MHDIDLYTWTTPNGWKTAATFEELGVPYNVIPIDITTNIQKEPEYLAINPNGRIPAIVDHAEDLTIFESGAIMIYLAEKTGKLLPKDKKGRFAVMQWLMFQMSGVGPMQGQANIFYRFFPEKLPSVIERYHNETMRLYGVLNHQLSQTEYLAGDYSIADIANWGWIRMHKFSGIEIDEFEYLSLWLDKLESRPALQRGAAIPHVTYFSDR